MSDELELRKLISQQGGAQSLVSKEQALNVIESLVLKAGRNQLTPSDKELLDRLKAAGFVAEDI